MHQLEWIERNTEQLRRKAIEANQRITQQKKTGKTRSLALDYSTM
jgi:hypothetical protein